MTENHLVVGYNPTQNIIGISAFDANIGGFQLSFTKNADYSKATYPMSIIYSVPSSPIQNVIILHAKEYIDMDTKTQLTDFDFDEASTLSTEQKKQILT